MLARGQKGLAFATVVVVAVVIGVVAAIAVLLPLASKVVQRLRVLSFQLCTSACKQ